METTTHSFPLKLSTGFTQDQPEFWLHFIKAYKTDVDKRKFCEVQYSVAKANLLHNTAVDFLDFCGSHPTKSALVRWCEENNHQYSNELMQRVLNLSLHYA